MTNETEYLTITVDATRRVIVLSIGGQSVTYTDPEEVRGVAEDIESAIRAYYAL